MIEIIIGIVCIILICRLIKKERESKAMRIALNTSNEVNEDAKKVTRDLRNEVTSYQKQVMEMKHDNGNLSSQVQSLEKEKKALNADYNELVQSKLAIEIKLNDLDLELFQTKQIIQTQNQTIENLKQLLPPAEPIKEFSEDEQKVIDEMKEETATKPTNRKTTKKG